MGMLKIPRSARYRKRVGMFGRVDAKHDQSTLDFNTAATCYNFDTASGALRAGYGVAAHKYVPENARRYWVYRYYSESEGRYVDQYVFQLANGLLRYFDELLGKPYYISGQQFPPVQALNYRLNSKDVLLISCEGRKLIAWNGSVLKEFEGSPVISSMALHYERLFVTSRDEPTKVFFSENLDPTNWEIGADGGGFIELLDERGEMNKVVSFGTYLYIFRDHGISRITAYGDQREFTAVNLFVTAGRIYPSSIAKCGANMMFAASDGLYVFDGYDCRRVLGNLDGLIVPDDNCASAFFNGKYYLACKMDFKDAAAIGCESVEHTVNGLLVYDGATGEYAISRGLDLSFMNACTFMGEDMLVCCDGGTGGVITRCGGRFDEALPKRWQSPETDFAAPDKTKVLREIYVKPSVNCEIALSSGNKEKRVAVRAGDRRVRVNFSAKRFSLAVDCDSRDCDIPAPTLVYGSYG